MFEELSSVTFYRQQSRDVSLCANGSGALLAEHRYGGRGRKRGGHFYGGGSLEYIDSQPLCVDRQDLRFLPPPTSSSGLEAPGGWQVGAPLGSGDTENRDSGQTKTFQRRATEC